MTALVVLKYPDEIILASDGKMTGLDGSYSTYQKIQGIGDYFFTAEGLYSDAETDFNLLNAAMFGIVAGQSFEENVADVELHLKTYLKDTYNKWKSTGNTAALQLCARLSFILATFEYEQPKVAVIMCYKNDTGNTVEVESKVIKLEEKKGGWISGAASLEFANQNGKAYKNNRAEFALKLIQVEIQARPASVGYPVYVLRLNKEDHALKIFKMEESE